MLYIWYRSVHWFHGSNLGEGKSVDQFYGLMLPDIANYVWNDLCLMQIPV
jgi:hypothetical protein